MTSVRAAKNKGSGFEYDVLFSLQQYHKNMYLTSKQGFQQQIDLLDDKDKIAVECKFHRSISWNEAKKYLDKLISKSPKDYRCFLVYKTNFQPVMLMRKGVMNSDYSGYYLIEFEGEYAFQKHPSTRL